MTSSTFSVDSASLDSASIKTASIVTAAVKTAAVKTASVKTASVKTASVDSAAVNTVSVDDSSVATGRIYNIAEVAGHPPVSARDFVGEVEFAIDWHGAPYRVTGRGVQGSADVVRFFETDGAHGGREVRVWDIATHPGGGFMAYQLDSELPIRNVIPQQVSR
jgi:hypothetical protein